MKLIKQADDEVCLSFEGKQAKLFYRKTSKFNRYVFNMEKNWIFLTFHLKILILSCSNRSQDSIWSYCICHTIRWSDSICRWNWETQGKDYSSFDIAWYTWKGNGSCYHFVRSKWAGDLLCWRWSIHWVIAIWPKIGQRTRQIRRWGSIPKEINKILWICSSTSSYIDLKQKWGCWLEMLFKNIFLWWQK